MAKEGKSPSYLQGLNTRLRFFKDFIQDTYDRMINVQELDVEDGRGFIRSLQSRQKKYTDHPMHEPV